MPRFSIIVPVYNVESYLGQCIDSILKQTFSDFELICINDGSTDNSARILEYYSAIDSRCSIIQQTNQGQSKARNVGISHANGEWIMFVDSDDWIDANALKILNSFCVEGDYDMIAFNMQRFYEDKQYFENAPEITAADYLTGWEYYCSESTKYRSLPFVSPCLRIYKRNLFILHKLTFKPDCYHEDNLFTPIVCHLSRGGVKVIPDILYFYRIREGSVMSSNNEKHAFDMVKVCNDLGQYFLNSTLSVKKYDITACKTIASLYRRAFEYGNPQIDDKLKKNIEWTFFRIASQHAGFKSFVAFSTISFAPALYRLLFKKLNKMS